MSTLSAGVHSQRVRQSRLQLLARKHSPGAGFRQPRQQFFRVSQVILIGVMSRSPRRLAAQGPGARLRANLQYERRWLPVGCA